jgi:hypothetical protein
MMSLSRISAAFTLIALLVLIVVVAIWGTQNMGTQITHGNMISHEHGVVLSKSDVDNSLIFKTDGGQTMRLICSERCLTELGHIQRHINEHAPTDVYYKQDVAVDVD